MQNEKRILQLKKRFLRLYPDAEHYHVPSKEIEKKLGIVLPEDWKEISSFYSGEMLGPIWLSAPNFQGPGSNIVDETNMLRTSQFIDKPLPNRYVVLQNGDPSCIFMETQDNSTKPTRIIYCSTLDCDNLCKGLALVHDPLIFPSFTDFFEYLLDQEEEERRENEGITG